MTGIFEEINFDRDFKFYCFETEEMYESVHYLGVKMPIGKKDHVLKFKNFASKNMFQRDTKLIIRKIDGKNIFVVDADISSEESPLKQMFVKGFARLDNEANH